MDFTNIYDSWVNSEVVDKKTKVELLVLSKEEIESRFSSNLKFGTSGLRGIMGAGTNMINIYTLNHAAYAVGTYINKRFNKPVIALAYDTRHNSKEYAESCALVLNKLGIKTYIFDSYAPTPLLVGCIRYINAHAGIVITSSHNPKEYNGFKVYYNDGGGIVPPHDELVEYEMTRKEILSVEKMDMDDAVNNGLFNYFDSEYIDMFVNDMNEGVINKPIVKKHAPDVKIIYSALHGTGYKLANRVLSENGFNLISVREQQEADPDFKTAPYPNPEVLSTFDLAVKLASNFNPDIICASDPDSDRLGVMCKDKTGEYKLLNGNLVGSIFLEYILSNRKEIMNDDYFCRSIVTTRLTDRICLNYNIKCIKVLTGCKWIAERIENSRRLDSYVFGFEESIGYLIGTKIRDKNAISALLLMAEIVAVLKSKGMTLQNYIDSIYEKYGYFIENTVSIELKDDKMLDEIMSYIRSSKFTEFGELKVVSRVDYLKDHTNLYESNVIEFNLDKDMFVTIRPSGTEPKLKLYFSVTSNNEKESEYLLKKLKKDVIDKFKLKDYIK